MPIPTMPGMLEGRLMGLSINGYAVECETQCDFNFDVEMLPASAISSGRWKNFIPGVRSWSITVAGNTLLKNAGADIKTILNAVLTGEIVELSFRTHPDISPYLIISGQAIPRQGNLSSANVGFSGWNVVFQGINAFTVDWEQFWLIINAMPPTADYPVIVEQDPNNWT